jgi:hypothetical protein
VPATADCVTRHAEQSEDRANDHGDNAERPDDGDLRDKADDEENDAEKYHRELQTFSKADRGWGELAEPAYFLTGSPWTARLRFALFFNSTDSYLGSSASNTPANIAKARYGVP